MKKVLQFTSLFVLYILVLTACIPVSSVIGIPTVAPASTPQESQSQTAVRDAQVQSVEVQFMQTDPVQVNAIVRGNLTESCATFGDTQMSYASNTFQIKLLTVSPTDRGCAQITTPYAQTISLNTTDLLPGTYTVIANGVSAVFTLPADASQLLPSIQLVVSTSDGTVRIVEPNISLNATQAPAFNGLLPSGGSFAGTAYVLDSTNQVKVVAIDANGAHNLSFIQNPTTYGLAVWQGGGGTQPRLAWGTQSTSSTLSSSLQISAPDGSQLETLLTQDATNPTTQLVAEFWSADGQSLYFSKEPMGLGGYILFGGASNLYLINISTKEVTEVIPLAPSSGPQACLDAISADYRYVADHCLQNTITIRDLTSGGTTTILPPVDVTGFKFAGSARFSPDGSRLAFALARGDQNNERGWVAVSDGTSGGSKLILTGQAGTYYTVAGWLNDQTLLVQSTNSLDCTPYCSSELWTVRVDGTNPQKVADGSLLTVITDGMNPGSTPPVVAPTSVPSPTPDASQTKIFSSDTYHYQFSYPANWTIQVNTAVPPGAGSNPEYVTVKANDGSNLPQIAVEVLTDAPPMLGY